MPVLPPGVISRVLIDRARVYGPTATTDMYDVPLSAEFPCRLTAKREATLATGIGAVRTQYYHLTYPTDITLPEGYWEIRVAGDRYAPRSNSQAPLRDLAGHIVWQGIDLDYLGPASA